MPSTASRFRGLHPLAALAVVAMLLALILVSAVFAATGNMKLNRVPGMTAYVAYLSVLLTMVGMVIGGLAFLLNHRFWGLPNFHRAVVGGAATCGLTAFLFVSGYARYIGAFGPETSSIAIWTTLGFAMVGAAAGVLHWFLSEPQTKPLE